MLPQLPFDIFFHVLYSLAPSRLCDDAARALASCLQVNRVFHHICQHPDIWKPHYDCRYTLSDNASEVSRRQKFGDNWRVRYAERRRIDKTAMALLQDMVTDRKHRYDRAKALATVAQDAWDALDIARRLPIPPSFRLSAFELDGSVHPHALTSRHWADLMADAIIKGSALDIWEEVLDDDTLFSAGANAKPDSGENFDMAMSAFSCFFGTPLSETTSQLDRLAAECRAFLIREGFSLDPSDPAYDLGRTCKGICQFMNEQGFDVADSPDYRNMLNHFPHSYLTSTRKLLPISLVHVFVAICRRIRIPATPVNFPGTVLAHVGARSQGFIVNPSMKDPARSTMDITDLQAMASNLSVPPDSVQRYLVPCTATAMLTRHSNNILHAFQTDGTGDVDSWHPALLATVLIHFLMEAELSFLRLLMTSLVDVTALECSTLLLSKLGDYVPPAQRGLLGQLCDPVLSKEVEAASTQCIRRANSNVKYFVGMAFQHARCSYTGCIIGWDLTCKASEQWLRQMEVDSLTSGESQPFYHTLSDDGTSTYVAEENIVPINPTIQFVQMLYRTTPELPVFFEDVELHENNGRGRFLLSPDSRFGFPQDDEVGARWVNDGQLPY